MSSANSLHFCKAGRACWIISSVFFLLITPFLVNEAPAQEASIAVRGAVQTELSLSLADIKIMPPMLIRDVPVIPERIRDRKDQDRVAQTTFRGRWVRYVDHRRRQYRRPFCQTHQKNRSTANKSIAGGGCDRSGRGIGRG